MTTSQNKPAPNEPSAQSNKPVILQGMGTKLLVLILCAVSFVAGFYAHQARQINHCESLGQVAQKQGSVVICT